MTAQKDAPGSFMLWALSVNQFSTFEHPFSFIRAGYQRVLKLRYR